jgi:hypothetical protein
MKKTCIPLHSFLILFSSFEMGSDIIAGEKPTIELKEGKTSIDGL